MLPGLPSVNTIMSGTVPSTEHGTVRLPDTDTSLLEAKQMTPTEELDLVKKAIQMGGTVTGGLFVEMRLLDPDVDCPAVLLVNAHPQHT